MVSKIVEYIGRSRALALPAFATFTGVDTTAALMNRPKIRCWNTWTAYPAITLAFQKMSKPVSDPAELLPFLPIIETYVNKLFLGEACESSSVDEVRLDCIIHKSKDFSHIPPSSDALFQKVLRTVMQVMNDPPPKVKK